MLLSESSWSWWWSETTLVVFFQAFFSVANTQSDPVLKYVNNVDREVYEDVERNLNFFEKSRGKIIRGNQRCTGFFLVKLDLRYVSLIEEF